MRKQDSNENIKNHQVNFFFSNHTLTIIFSRICCCQLYKERDLSVKRPGYGSQIHMHMAATYMVLYSLYKSRLRQIKIRGCHTRCFHPFHILFTLFVLSSSATPASESSFYTLIHLAHSYLLVVKNEKSWAKYLNLGFQALNLTSNNFLVS